MLVKTHKILWGKSGSKCAFADCRIDLVMDETETDDPSVVGEEAHIVARSNDGPRGQSTLTAEQRDKYDNLILLCRVHHKLIDDQENTYTVEAVRQIKKEHEEWVNKNLSIDKVMQHDDLIYSDYIDKIVELASVNQWTSWTEWLFTANQPKLYESYLNNLDKLNKYILGRVWPNRYPDLEKAFKNLRVVTNDLLSVFSEHSEKGEDSDVGDDVMVSTYQFYRIREWDPERYHTLAKKYDFHCMLVGDLVMEMTRAMNHLFDMVRLYLLPGFRIKEGILLITIGPMADFAWHTFRVEYKAEERIELYPDLRRFMEIRHTRDNYRGKGVDEDYFRDFLD